MKIKPVLVLSVILLGLGLGGSGCSKTPDLYQQLEAIASPHRFSLAAWEVRTIPHELGQLASGWRRRTADEVKTVTDHFDTIGRIRVLKSQIQAIEYGHLPYDSAQLEAELETLREETLASQDEVERILEKQIKTVLAEQDIFNPWDIYRVRPRVNFPPLNFKLEPLPKLLVISPRERIESLKEFILTPDITSEEIAAVEAAADELGVSSLVVELGGLGATYPSLVTNEASLSFTIDAAAEEWLHQYLFPRPLGFLYTLDLTGISPNYEIATINETVASMASKEIGALVYEKYYAPEASTGESSQEDGAGFDFNREMRDIRRRVDEYLTCGEVELAEEFMEESRQYLADNGYYLRKLNQAYFAFHGAYADSPTSVSPIGVELAQLRKQSPSLKEFLNQTTAITSRQHLQEMLK
ncbi:MAG: hypothetical protein JW790_02800 [Dehalococcoidales bacterium]|nr:hypothetical protein [Dehalococcoidales bacterium]